MQNLFRPRMKEIVVENSMSAPAAFSGLGRAGSGCVFSVASSSNTRALAARACSRLFCNRARFLMGRYMVKISQA